METGLLIYGNALDYYNQAPKPTVIISDGPYGVSGYDTDEKTHKNLADIYEPHIRSWAENSDAQTTLWFWCTEVGWATVHPILEKYGWIYNGCNIWDKTIKHIAGNCNGKTMRKFPIVTEVCVQYVRKTIFKDKLGKEENIQDWLRNEWKRSGLPFSKANDACGVKNAASRKYLTKDHLWYFPPKKEFELMVEYANKYGEKSGLPYFSLDQKTPLSGNRWEKLRAKFNFEYGATNVWMCPTVSSKERLKNKEGQTHPNQKPEKLMERIILASSDEGDTIWEPFLGTGSGCFVAKKLKRKYWGCEINKSYYDLAFLRCEK